MSRSYRSRRLYLVTFLTLIAVIAGWVLVAGNLKLPEFVTAFHSALRRPTVSAQLMYYDPLPADAMDDDNCKLVPVSASTALAADPLQRRGPLGRPPLLTCPGKTGAYDPRPLRSYSSVAVDPTNNEVVVTDENLFNVLIYNRLANTPPTAMTEPEARHRGTEDKD